MKREILSIKIQAYDDRDRFVSNAKVTIRRKGIVGDPLYAFGNEYEDISWASLARAQRAQVALLKRGER